MQVPRWLAPPLSERTAIETVTEETDTEYGFTWLTVDGNYLLRTSDDQFKGVPEVVVETLKEHAPDTSVEELIAETAEMDAGAGDVLREMRDEGFLREDAPVERVVPPEDIRLWHRVVAVGVVVALAGVVWAETLSSLAGPILDHPFRYLLGTAPISIPLIVGSVAVHEFGHYYTAWKQGLAPSFGVSVINGVVPALVTRTHGGWALPRNRRMWNTLAGPAYGLLWTLGVFGLYYAALPHPGIGIAGVVCFNFQVSALLPLFHGDGYLLMTDVLDEQNLRSRGVRDLRAARPTWPSAYVAVSYGVVVALYAVNLVVGYLVGDVLGAGVVLVLTGSIYAESRFEVARRLLTVISPSDG